MAQDFEAYWANIRANVAGCDSDWDRISRTQTVSANGGEWTVHWLRFSSVNDALIWAWFAVPLDRAPNGVGMIWLPGYSYGTPPPDATCLIPGVCTLCANVHRNMPDAPYENPAGKNDYIVQDIDDRSSYIYNRIACHSLRAAAVLSDQPEVRQDRVVAAGMSQGAALAIIVASQIQSIGLCLADMPFLADIRVSLATSSSPVYKKFRDYAASSADPDALVDTLSLFDPVRHAPYVRVPTWLSAGGRDPAVKPPTVQAVYRAIASENKHYEYFPSAGHVFLPEMNLAHTNWIRRYILNEEA